MIKHQSDYEYIIVGSGAGGGTLAARLAENGCKVLLLEAGGDPKNLQGGNAAYPDAERLPEDYDVPVFHALSNENHAIKWDFFVQHYSNKPERDPKYVDQEGGILYPRAGTLGGCTAHNALIMVYPHNQDWDDIADLTGDETWRSGNMRKYFERMENCHHRPFPPWRWIYKLFRWNPTRHGFKGWLSIEKAIPETAVLGDPSLLTAIVKSARTAFKTVSMKWHRITWLFEGKGDPNDWRLVKENSVGLRYPPLATRNHARNSSREFLLDVLGRYPENLTIELNALATKVLFDEQNRAIGVEFLKGERLYQAHYEPSKESGERLTANASREVILCGGAFNTPQLLMLSGIGPKKALERFGLRTRVPLAGVGRNLQDRYEVGVVNRMKQDWKILEGAKFAKGDPQFEMWEKHRKGVYTTNGAVVAVVKRSDPARPLPDLFCFALVGRFAGYAPGFSTELVKYHNYLTWAVLKAHTRNTAGYVTLDDRDGRDPRNPCQRPVINFKYFEEGNDEHQEDIESVVDGVEFVRTLTAPLQDLIDEEELPGKDKQSRADLREFVANHAWGHHASCTCKIGTRDDPKAVLDNNFRVFGTQGLRVVDASVFPKIPGFFIVTSVFMVAEKAADVILADAGKLPHGESTRGLLGRLWHGFKTALRTLWRWLWRPLAVVLAILALIVTSSWVIFEPMSRPEGPAEVRQVTDDIVELLTGKLKHQYGDAPQFLRDTHPKANACVLADFEINNDLDEIYRAGVFQPGVSYKSWIRFSNAADHVTPDTAADFRGMAVKLLGVPGEKLEVPSPELLEKFGFVDDDSEPNSQDFLFIAHEAFFAGNVKHFRDFFRAVVSRGDSVPDNPLTNPSLLLHLLTHPRGAFNAAVGTRIYPSLADIEWFGVAPFKLGQRIVKYVVTPCERPFHPPNVDRTSANYLQGRLVDQLNPSWGGEICLNFNIQLRQDNWPVDNTLIAWPATDDNGNPTWQSVAKIHIRSQQFTTPEQEEFCQNITYNPWHSLSAHEPIGDVNIARRDVMFALQKVRLEANERQRFEPAGEECFFTGAKFPWLDDGPCRRDSAAQEATTTPNDPEYAQP